MFLSNLSIKRPVFATVMMLALVTLGISSYQRLPVDLYPDVEIPVISVVTLYPGASPETVEREVSKRIEEAVHPIAGVKHIGSTSREGVSQLFVEFELEISADRAVQDARTKIAAIRGDLPAAVEDPIVDKLNIAGFPIVSLAVRSTTLPPRELTTFVEKKVQRRLENVTGVGKVDLVGASKREIRVDVDVDRLEALGMTVDEVALGLRSENIDTPLGRMTGARSEVPVRVQGKARNVAEFEAMTIGRRAGRPISLGEIARVEDGVEEERSLAIVNGTPAVALDVLKQTGANATGLAEAIKREVAAIAPELPAGTHIDIVRDGSVFIRESVADVQQTLLLGGVLTVLIVFLFLNSWRSTVITGLTLPISVISSFIVMNFAGMTLNVMTLMALSLAIGLLIDDAIVVRENIVRHLQKGEDYFEAARNGTSEIGLAVLATSFSIVAVFVPVAFMKGVVGRFFFAFGITVAFSVLVSLFVSFTLDPMLSSRWVDPDIAKVGRRHFIARVLDRFNAWFERTADKYRVVIAWALDHRFVVIAFAVAAFVAGVAVMGVLQSEFFPQADQGEFVANFKTAPSASIDETRNRLDAVLRELKPLPEIETTYASIGAGDAGTVHDGRVYIRLKERHERQRTQHAIERDVRARLATVPGIIASLGQAQSFDNRKPLLVGVRGDDIAVLKQYSHKLETALYGEPGIVDLETSLEHDAPEYRLMIDRVRATDAGLTTGSIADAVGTLVGGREVTTFEDEEGDARTVRLRLPISRRQEAADVAGLRLVTRGTPGTLPSLLPLHSLARYELSRVASEINRTDLAREVTVSANLDGLPLGSAVAKVHEAGTTLGLPPGYRLVVSGENEAMDESFKAMAEALLLAVVFVYLILAAQFESFIDPFAIMLSLPLSLVGMSGMLLLTGDTVNIMSLIGLIMLMGLVTKNAILLVDYAKVLRGRGLARREAIIEAGRTRLRPIVMTTSAMIFGMLPLALALGAGAEMRAPMARAVIGGLLTSTLLTLLVVPVVYSVLDDFATWLSRHPPSLHAAGAGAVVAAIVLATPALARAQAASPSVRPASATPVRVLTLDEALRLAAEQNHDVKRSVEYRTWVDGKYTEERASALPQVTFGGNLLRTFDDSQSKLFRNLPGIGGAATNTTDTPGFADVFGGRQDIRIAEFKVTQPIFTWGKLGAAVRAAAVGFRFADDQIRQSRQAAMRDVATAFYDVLAAREMVRIAEQDCDQKTRHLDEARRRRSLGTATDYDILAAEVALQNAQPALIRARNAVTVAREQLGFLLAAGDTEVDVQGTLTGPTEPAPLYDQLLGEALKNRPELSMIASQRGIYTELMTVEKAANKPRLDLAAGFGSRTLGMKVLSATGTTWNLAVIASVPVFDGNRTRGRVAQARSDAAQLSIEEAKLRDSIALQLRTAVNAVQEAREIVGAITGTVAQAEKLVFLAEKGFELGVNTRLDVQDAEMNYLAARGNLARAQRDYRVALVTLGWVCGVDSLKSLIANP